MAGIELASKKIISPDLTSAADAVTNLLRNAIIYGQFAPGERIHQARVAEDLGVSRQPVREALARLRAEGLVVSLLGGGSAVGELNIDSVRENYWLRTLLEGEATKEAAGRITAGQLEELATTNSRLDFDQKREDAEHVLDLNRHFHATIWLASGLIATTRILDEVWASVTTATPLLIPQRGSKSVHEHEAIIQALRNGDGQRAMDAMRQHIGSAADDFERTVLADAAASTRLRADAKLDESARRDGDAR